MAFINYAHRGASAYAPENTLAAFYMGVNMRANGIETDVQLTKDGVPVLFHDGTMQRILGRPEAIHDFTYNELLAFDFGAHKGEAFIGEKLPTLEEFLRHFGAKPLHFAIELKEPGAEEKTLALVKRYLPSDRVIVTSARWQSLLAARALDPDICLGFLTKELTCGLLSEAKQANIGQICPKACALTAEWNERLRAASFSVRAWGIDSEQTMQKMLKLKVDGMTVNFPDLLFKALNEQTA